MHYILILILFFNFSYAKSEIDTKIKKTSAKLDSYHKNYLNINKKMAKTAKAILKQKRELEKQSRYLEALKVELTKKETTYEKNKKDLANLNKSQYGLKKKQQKIEEELVFVIAKSVSLSIILDEAYAKNEESLIELEVLKAMLKNSKSKASELSEKFFLNAKDISTLDKKAKILEDAISLIDSKRKKVIKIQKENKKALRKLQLAKQSYKKELKKLISKQNLLKQTLSQLNIIKIDEERKAKEERERKKAFARKQINLKENLPKVKKVGNSYQAIKTIRYRGRKTIPPISRYTITKKYGKYTDPIYGIKIFNESISLKPKKQNAKVKTVFNGKVIYADKTAVLDNIVIVEHKNGMHTIYANLSKIAPNIKKGKKVKKGAVIGRVKDELIFEVTQRSYHINPVELFK